MGLSLWAVVVVVLVVGQLQDMLRHKGIHRADAKVVVELGRLAIWFGW